MSDRYLYKAKRTDNGEWVVWNALSGIPHDISISDNTICQCTGLTDKNGKLIWEGDIVKHFNCPGNKDIYVLSRIEWNQNDCRFIKRNADQAQYCIGGKSIYEVIGNVFDNPELLEAQNE